MKYDEDKFLVSCEQPNTAKPLSSDAVLAEVRALIEAISKFQEIVLTDELQLLGIDSMDALLNINRLKDKVSEHIWEKQNEVSRNNQV